MLDIQAVAKNRQHWQKKIYKKFAVSEIRRTFALGNGNKPDTKKLFDNIDSDIAAAKVGYICLFAVCHYAI